MTSSSTASVRNLPYWWRVTRYDPARRENRGGYRDATWTSIADVGKVFNGSILTIQEYEQVERAYLDTFVSFAEESHVELLQVRSVDDGGDGLTEGSIVRLRDAVEIVRRMLREEVICKLEAPTDDFALHVGFDLYMYVGSTQPCPHATERSRELGLFVEEDWPSPQLPG
jgi:hypothetical protein